MSKDTSGTAYPIRAPSGMPIFGVTIRDYFAAKAMQAMVAAEFDMHAVESKHPNGMTVGERWAQQAYQMADAMLVERAKPDALPEPTTNQLIAQLADDEKWTPEEQRQFGVFLQRFPNESSKGIIALGAAWKHGKASVERAK